MEAVELGSVRPSQEPPERKGAEPFPALIFKQMRLSFHQRLLLTLICLGALPAALAIVGWGLSIRSSTRSPGARSAIEEVASSGRALLRTIDSTRLRPEERRALADHANKLNA